MLVGLTYDLRTAYLAEGYSEEETAEFDRPDTVDAIEAAVRRRGHQTERIGHARQLVERLAAGRRWDLVFNICEGLRGLGREAQVPAILDVYGIPYTFSDPLVMSVALHKGITKRILRDAGIATTDFRVVSSPAELDRGDITWSLFPAFAKPVAEGTGKGVTPASKIRSADELPPVCRDLLARYRQPVLLEPYLPGREFTVGILGTGDRARVLGTMEIVLRPAAEPEVYSYANKENCEELVDYLFPPPSDPQVAAAEELALRAWRVLDCRDGGRIDLRCDAQEKPQFLEVNPLAGLHPLHSDLPMIATARGMSYADLIGVILDSAAERRI